MEKQGLYVIYDRTAEEGSAPFMALNHGIALRNYRNLMADVPAFSKADFRLYHTAWYCPKTMELTVLDERTEVLYKED